MGFALNLIWDLRHLTRFPPDRTKLENPRMKTFEKYLKQCNLTYEINTISSAMEAALFDVTLGHFEQPVFAPLFDNSWQCIKGAMVDPSLPCKA